MTKLRKNFRNLLQYKQQIHVDKSKVDTCDELGFKTIKGFCRLCDSVIYDIDNYKVIGETWGVNHLSHIDCIPQSLDTMKDFQDFKYIVKNKSC